MIRIMLQKLIHKKWLVISLLIGNILLIAITASYPMYRESSLQKMLTTEFENYKEANNVYPAQIVLGHAMDKENQANDFWEMEEKSNNICNNLGLTIKEIVTQYHTTNSKMIPKMIRDGDDNEKVFDLYSMSDFKKHSTIISGTEFSDSVSEDGLIDAVVSQATFDHLGLLVGDEFTCSNLKGKNGQQLKLRIAGIFTISNKDDTYWNIAPSELINGLFISQDIFKSELLYDNQFHNALTGQWVVNFDYKKVIPDQVTSLYNKTSSMVTASSTIHKSFSEPAYLQVLYNYSSKINKINSTLLILIIPLFVLLCAFIFMISTQMLNMEENEISLFKSRGASKKQIFTLYLLQSICLSVGSLVFAIPLAGLLCRILGSANAFLEFVQRTSLTITYSKSVVLYSLGAMSVSILITILPVLKSSAISIVNLKQKKARSQKVFWQKFYLDVVMLGVSLYGFYSYSRQKTDILYRVVGGQSIDPLLFLSSSLFILGAGLFALRLQPLLIKLLFKVGMKKWKPANYASLLQIIRTGRKQYFIMVFMILTVALGIFNSTIARTIVLNAEENTAYSTGTDIAFQEEWRNNLGAVLSSPEPIPFVWYEPEYIRFSKLNEVASLAKVYRNPNVVANSSDDMKTEVMAISTKDFGNTARLPEGLNNHMFNEYLNVLSTNPNAVILSSNYATQKGYKIGDTIEFSNDNDEISYNIEGDKTVRAVIYAFVDYWPGYKPTSIKTYQNGTCGTVDNYLIIANLGNIQQQWKIEPYQVWMKLKNKDTGFFYNFIQNQDINLEMLADKEQEVLNISKDSMFQGTNGILTMSFIVILILCFIGYLIYWILSIRSRELLFGVFRAMGMSKREIIRMLINEQVFTGGLAIALGAGIGLLASHLYIPMIQIAYAGDNQALPLELMTKASDMVRLFVIVALVFVVCISVLVSIVNKLKISEALKLGED